MEEYMINEGFVVDSDQKAEWCLQKIAENEAEKSKWTEYYDSMKKRVSDDCDNRITYLKSMLYRYFETVPHKDTKSEENYRLPSGKLVLTKVKTEIVRPENDADLLKFLRNNAPEYIKHSESVNWSEYKKTLMVVGKNVVDSDGQIIPCITTTTKDPEFKIGK